MQCLQVIACISSLGVALGAQDLPIAQNLVPVPLATEPALRAELADLFRGAQHLGSVGFDTTFEVVAYPAVPAGRGAAGLTPKSRTRIRYLVSGDCMRVESMRLSEPESSPVLQVNVWSDGGWSQRRDDEKYVAFSDRAGPVDVPGQGYLFNLMDGRFPGLVPITTILREGQLKRQSRRDGMVWSELVPSFGRDGMVVYNICLGAAPDPQLERLSIEILTGEPKKCKTRQVFQVTAWKDYGGLRLPEEAELKAWQASINTDEVQGAADILTIYRRTAFRLLGPGEDLSEAFLTPLPTGTKVHDARQGMSYEIGADYLFIDGTMYQLQRPLQEPPGEALSELMRTAIRRVEGPTAKSAAPLSGGASSATRPESDSRSWVRVAVGGMVGVGALASIVFVVWRWRRPAI